MKSNLYTLSQNKHSATSTPEAFNKYYLANIRCSKRRDIIGSDKHSKNN